MTKLCSVLIPTRKRPAQLLHTIGSIRQTSKVENVDICLRVDEDDHETIGLLCQIVVVAKGGIRIMIGPRLEGYGSIHVFCNELVTLCDSRWVVPINDDITLESDGWDLQLLQVPLDGSVAWPRVYRLGGSTYDSPSVGWVCPFIPRSTWLKYSCFPPVDDYWRTMVDNHGWPVHILDMTVNHQRDENNTREIGEK